MELLVDFNQVESDGRIPALFPQGPASALVRGTEVVARDGEGTECHAVVDEVSPDGRYVMLVPIEGTARPSDVGPSTSGSSVR
jgi:hypothetical protein